MIPELGQLATSIAFVLAVAIGVCGLWPEVRWRETLSRALPVLVSGQLAFLLLAFAALTLSFLQDDFSVAYVAKNSNSLLPWYYKASAVWGGHEGSFLLWTLIMAVWMFAVAVRGQLLPPDFLARVLGVMGVLSVGFLAFLLFTSNPFLRLVPLTPVDGADLNPLLQDFGLIVHPPMLYTGYVGFSVAFSFAIAALLCGRLDAAWARWSRPWTNVAWAFLTVGIALGSWWAYYELGWGGWWFWDPVENASFMPWLVGTALVHSLAATEKRNVFKSWTLMLAIAAFSLSLLGAFIVRSGVLTSVHAFAVDPERGVFILVFLVLVVGGSLALYAVRAGTLHTRSTYTVASRELFLLVNNIVLMLSVAVVLLGTLYPLIYEALFDAKISVGMEWFNYFFVPLMLILAAALAVSPALNWKRTATARIVSRTAPALAGGVVLGVLIPLVIDGSLSFTAVIALILALWMVGTHGVDLVRRLPGSLPLAYWGMTLAHLGFAASMIGIAFTIDLSSESDIRMAPGDVVSVRGVDVQFDGVTRVKGPNYEASQGHFTITEDGERFELLPQKRRYLAGGNVMTEAAIDAGFLRDVYISLGEPLQGGAWAVRVHIKPLVRWIWLGGLLAAFGGMLAVADRRYQVVRRRLLQTAGGAA